MCGISGFNRANKSSIPDAREMMRNMAIAIEPRGHHATGFAWPDAIGHPMYSKLEGRASKVVDLFPLPTGMRAGIVHTRFATQGSPSRTENNHPVIGPGIALVHNGCIDNDDDLFAMMPWYNRLGEVDSEAAVALIASYRRLGAKHVTEVLELIEGSAALAWIDSDHPDELHLARLSTRPMAIAWTRRGDLVMSSTELTLQQAMKRTNVYIGKTRPVTEGTYLRVAHGQIIEQRKFKVSKRKYTYKPSKNTAPLGGWDWDDDPRRPKATFLNQNGSTPSKPKKETTTIGATPSYDPDILDSFDRVEYEREIEEGMYDGVLDFETYVARKGWSS
jgi:glucosamine 6-phosphate synthetase-like amidotransferase/phosphosugar isomerase protein